MPVSISGTNGVTFPDSSLQAAAASPYVLKNRLINGNMDIWQRGTTFTGSGTLTYFADRWSSVQYAGSTSTVTRQSSGITGISYCMRVQRPNGGTNTGTINVGQSIESINCLDLAGQSVTFSFYARAGSNFSAASSALISAIYSGTGTDQNLYNGYTGSTDSTATNTLTTSWQKFSLTRTIPSNATEVGVAFYYTPVGTAGANDYYEITQLQLEIGSTATPFEQILISQELINCQRYFEKSFAVNTTPVTNLGVGTGESFLTCNPTVGNGYSTNIFFRVTKRTTPTSVILYNRSVASNTFMWYTSGGSTANGGNIEALGENSFAVQYPGGTTYTITTGHWTASAEL
jgi:hypothetical protein